MVRLTKADAETLIDSIDTPLLGAALAIAVRKALGIDGFDGDWAALVRLAADRERWSPTRCWTLIEEQPDALADLATELSERRTL